LAAAIDPNDRSHQPHCPKEDTLQPKTPIVAAGIDPNHAESLVTPVTAAGVDPNHAESLVTPVTAAGMELNHAESLVG
jgi:hypothetical protein